MKPRNAAIAGICCLIAAQVLASFALKPMRAATVTAGDALTAVKPGEFAGTLMLGGFRGLACDLLWMRAMSAKENRRFYESVALFQAIARVQPRFEQIWEYMSWDLAYNISVEVDDEDGKWSWYLAGLDANVRGCRRNPESERLLRHLAWMFHHKGDLYHQRVLDADWAPLMNPLIADLNRRLDADCALPPWPPGTGHTNFELATYCYRAAFVVAQHEGKRVPAFVRRMIPHSIEKDGNLWRNRGEHLQALHRYLDCLRAWQVVRDWIASPDGTGDVHAHVGHGQTDPGDHRGHDHGTHAGQDDHAGHDHGDHAGHGHDDHDHPPVDAAAWRIEQDRHDKEISRDVTERNEGRVRRKAAELATLLAPDEATGQATAQAFLDRDWEAVERELTKPGWKSAHRRGGVIWLDE